MAVIVIGLPSGWMPANSTCGVPVAFQRAKRKQAIATTYIEQGSVLFQMDMAQYLIPNGMEKIEHLFHSLGITPEAAMEQPLTPDIFLGITHTHFHSFVACFISAKSMCLLLQQVLHDMERDTPEEVGMLVLDFAMKIFLTHCEMCLFPHGF